MQFSMDFSIFTNLYATAYNLMILKNYWSDIHKVLIANKNIVAG